MITSNINNRINLPCQIIAHRLAPIQIILSASSPLTTGLKNIDYRLIGDLIVTETDVKNEYQEQLLTVEGSGVCYSYPVALPQPNLQLSRSSWGATEETVVFVATTNLFTLTPQLRETWIEIVAAVPHSILVICPKQTEDDTHIFPVLRRSMDALCEHYKLNNERLLITFLPSWEDVKQAVGLGDIYLEAFAGNHPMSLIQALSAGVPPVVKHGSIPHTKTASAILQALGLPELVADCSQSYLKVAIALASQTELRQHYHQRIQTLMQNHPQILDSQGYSQRIGHLLMQLMQQRRGNLK